MGKHHDLVDFTKRYKGDLHEFFLDVASWRKFTSSHPLVWQRVKFEDASRDGVPTERGIYVFTMEVGGLGLPAHGYILYVGITGDEGNATLRSRYGQYLRNLVNEDGRPAVVYMLMNWSDDLYFNYVPIPDKAVDLAQIERSFINSVIPPVNKRDFDAEIAAGKAATF